jgi:uncharacterized small protein (DUF1192 family)
MEDHEHLDYAAELAKLNRKVTLLEVGLDRAEDRIGLLQDEIDRLRTDLYNAGL